MGNTQRETSNRKRATVTSHVVQRDGYEISFQILRPGSSSSDEKLLAVILINPPTDYSEAGSEYEMMASEILAETGKVAAVMVKVSGFENSIFEYYGAMKWISCNATALGLNGRIAVAGIGLGANTTAVLMLMAHEEELPGICFQLLIDPEFMYSKPAAHFSVLSNGCVSYSDNDKWISLKDTYDLPLYAGIDTLHGMPDTIIHGSETYRGCNELDYYCSQLEEASNTVSYHNYTKMNSDNEKANANTMPERVWNGLGEYIAGQFGRCEFNEF